MQQRVLVTGGAGFIGSNFVAYLRRRFPEVRITVLDALTYAGSVDKLDLPPPHRFVHGNVLDRPLVTELVADADVVFHFAAETHVTRSIYDNAIFFETDVLGTQVVANAVLANARTIDRFVHVSTSEVYGTALTDAIDEAHPLMPTSPYAAAKCGADRLVYSYWNTYGIPAVIVRPFNNYGPHQHLEKAIPRFISSCLLGEPVTIHGNGSYSRDWVYVADTCEALGALMRAPREKVVGEVLNIGTGSCLDILTLARRICDAMGRSHEAIEFIAARPGQVDRHCAAVEKTARLLGWRAQTTLDVGLDATIAWYKGNRDRWEKQVDDRWIPITVADGVAVLQ